MKKRSDFNDLTGKVFGDLTVVSLAFTKNRVSHWNCLCKCGRNRIVRSRYLTQGIHTSCVVCSKIKNVGHHYVDLTGKRFHRLIVQHISHYDLLKRTYYWKCLCDCGKEVIIIGNSLKTNRTKSCGCLVSEKAKNRLFTNLIGKRFGRLFVIGHDGMKKTFRYWECVCDCGNKTKVKARDLRSGHTQSCGCLRKERSSEGCRNRRLPDNEAGFNRVYREYRNKNAERRDLSFELTKEQFRELTQKPCHYCGFMHSKNQLGFLYNGLDRVDNKKGYTIDNVVPCCFTCNISKARMTVEEFLSWIDRVHVYQSQKQNK